MPGTKQSVTIVTRVIGLDTLRGSVDAKAMFKEHNLEAGAKGSPDVDPHWKRYYALEEQGMLLIIGMFAVQDSTVDVMIGYSINFLMEHMHYQTVRVCQNDLVFVHPLWRSRHGLGRRLIHETESLARGRGAVRIFFHSAPGGALEHVLPRMSYEVQETIYTRAL
jgi:GNAT superfamily N-acetyltransferase